MSGRRQVAVVVGAGPGNGASLAVAFEIASAPCQSWPALFFIWRSAHRDMNQVPA